MNINFRASEAGAVITEYFFLTGVLILLSTIAAPPIGEAVTELLNLPIYDSCNTDEHIDDGSQTIYPTNGRSAPISNYHHCDSSGDVTAANDPDGEELDKMEI